jgi:hypothetical protein
MTTSRRILSLLAVALLAALAVTSLAGAAKPGRWADKSRKLDFGIAKDHKHFNFFDWTCKKDGSTLATPFPDGKHPKIRKHGKFKFTRSALVFKNGGPANKPVKFTMKGRFVTHHGKTRAVGTVRSRSTCGTKAKSFKAKWSPQQG